MASSVTYRGFIQWLGLSTEKLESGDPRIFQRMRPTYLQQAGGKIRFAGTAQQKNVFTWLVVSDGPNWLKGQAFIGTGDDLFDAMLSGLMTAYELIWLRRKQDGILPKT